MITIQGHATAMTDVCTHTQGLLDPRTTFRATLACVVRFHLQMLLVKCFSSFLSVSRFLLFLGKSSLETFQALFSFVIVPGIGYCIPFGVGQEAFESDINTDLFARWNVVNFAFCFNSELAIVAISSSDNPNLFDSFDWECFDVLFLIANQAESAYPTAIGESDMSAVIVKLPSGSLVLNAPIVMLKSGIAFLAGLFDLAMLIESLDSKPRTGSRGVTGLGIEAMGKREVTGQDSTIDLQVVFGDTTAIHPQAQTLVTDELHHADSLFDDLELLLVAIQLVLVDQHILDLSFCSMLLLYSLMGLYVKRRKNVCAKNESICISLSGKRGNWGSEAERRTYLWQRLSDALLMSIWLGMTQHMPLCPSPNQGMPIHPSLKWKGLSGLVSVTSAGASPRVEVNRHAGAIMQIKG